MGYLWKKPLLGRFKYTNGLSRKKGLRDIPKAIYGETREKIALGIPSFPSFMAIDW